MRPIIILGPPIVWIVVGCVVLPGLVILVIVIVCFVVMRHRKNRNGKNL